MRFDWDSEKAASNLAKHGVSFELAQAVWDDPLHVIVPDRIEHGEQRWHALGVIRTVTVVLVVHIYPEPDDEGRIRIISARKATAHERRRYEQENT